MVEFHGPRILKERYERTKRKIEIDGLEPDEIIASFRLAKRYEDWEFCWRLYADWVSPLLGKFDSSGTRVESREITKWLDQEWIQKSPLINGFLRTHLWNQFLCNVSDKEHLSNCSVFGSVCMRTMPTMTSLLSAAGIVVVLPNSYVCPGPNFPNLIPIPQDLFELW